MGLFNQMMRFFSGVSGQRLLAQIFQKRNNRISGITILLIGSIGAAVAFLFRRNGNMLKPLQTSMKNGSKNTNSFQLNKLLTAEIAEEIFPNKNNSEGNQESKSR